MAKNDVTLKILGDSSGATKALQEVETKSEGFGKKMGTIFGAIGGVALAKGVFDFGKASVGAFKESEDSAARLNDAFDKFPKLADANVASFNKLNQSLAKKTKFDDDATASGQAVLAQFNLTGKQIEQLTPLLQDYAAKTGKDLPAAAEVLGKAMIGNAKALKEVGISIPPAADIGKALDNAAKKVESTGKTMEDAQRRLNDLKEIQATKDKLTVQDQIALRNSQAAVKDATDAHGEAVAKLGRIQENAGKQGSKFDQIMGGLRSQVGGFAEKEGQTAAGKAQILSNQFGELQETVGSKLMPVLSTLAGWLLRIVDFISNLSPGVQMAIGVVAGLAAAAYVVVQAVQAWTAVLAALDVVLAANPIGLVVVAIAALVAGIVWAYNHVSWFHDGVQAAFAGLVAAGHWLAAVFSNVWDGIVSGFVWVVNNVKSLANWVVQHAINPAIDAINLLIRGYNMLPGHGDVGLLPHLPAFAKGGIVTSPTVALIGEAGPEAVVPLSGGGGFGMGTTVFVTVNAGQSLSTSRDISDKVADALTEFFGRGGSLGNGRGGSLKPA
jgi:hypothetical protein